MELPGTSKGNGSLCAAGHVRFLRDQSLKIESLPVIFNFLRVSRFPLDLPSLYVLLVLTLRYYWATSSMPDPPSSWGTEEATNAPVQEKVGRPAQAMGTQWLVLVPQFILLAKFFD